jgi:DNA-binding winged helix-turn-helix (wHTH) protein/Tol biopolymer transport system component
MSTIRFGLFEVDTQSGELRRHGSRVKLQEQPFQVLVLLLERPGEVVTREELTKRLWPDNTFVDFERGLNKAINRLRGALRDQPDKPRFIETLPQRGYRFIAPVEVTTNGHHPNSAATNGHHPTAVEEILPSPNAALGPTPVSQPVPQSGIWKLEELLLPPTGAPGPAPVPQPILQKHKWKLKAAMALAALVVMVSVLSLSDEKSYLARSRLGALLHRVSAGHRPRPQLALSERRLTANPDDAPVTSGVISPDGKYLAYSDPTGLYLRQVDGGETVSVPLPKGFDALPESWFPDSVHLVVSRVEGLKMPPSLWEISIMGGTPRKLANEGSSARVSPDGSKIVFLAGMWDNEEIWLFQVDENSARKIAANGKDYFGPPAWAPDGKRFAYVRTRESPGQRIDSKIEVSDVTNGRSESILSEPRLLRDIAWVSPGRLIYSLFETQPTQNVFNLWWVQLDSRTGRPLGSPTRITSDRTPTAGISVTSDGKRMALLRRSHQYDVYLTGVEAGGKRLTRPRRLTLDERQDFPTAWTPDSKAVLFFSDRDEPFHIYKQNIDQTQPELLVGGKDNVLLPRLTPDGLSVLYQVGAKPGEPSDTIRLMRVPLAGGPSQFVLEDRGIINVECARLPSTLCIYGQVEPGQQRFFTFDPAGGKGEQLLKAKLKTEQGPSTNWALSPDGKYLVTAKSSNPYEESGLRLFNLTQGKERDIPVSGLPLIMGMDWAADSKTLWITGYLGRGAWGARSALLNVDLTGKATVVLEGLNLELWAAIPSPDGRRLAVGRNTQSSNVSLLENF